MARPARWLRLNLVSVSGRCESGRPVGGGPAGAARLHSSGAVPALALFRTSAGAAVTSAEKLAVAVLAGRLRRDRRGCQAPVARVLIDATRRGEGYRTLPPPVPSWSAPTAD